jgi:5-methylcytosine-specific restriction protein A
VSQKPKQFKPKRVEGATKFKKARLYEKTSWAELRTKFLAINPLCYACGDSARIVDHVVAHKGDEEKFWNPTNMIPLCKRCHDFITASFDRHNPPKTEEKMRWIAGKREITETNIKVKITRSER